MITASVIKDLLLEVKFDDSLAIFQNLMALNFEQVHLAKANPSEINTFSK